MRLPSLALALASVAACALTTARAAEPVSVAEIANYSGADRQAMLEAGARREGALMVYTIGVQMPKIVEGFHKRYPFIAVDLSPASSSDIAQKVIEEYRAGTYNADVFELASHALLAPRELGVLQPYRSPEDASYEPDAIGPGHYWVSARETYIGLGYDTRKISADAAPKTYRDMLDPKWKGRMAISGYTATTANWVGAMQLSEGEDFVRRLGGQNIRIFNASGRAIANMMISGEVELSPAIYESHVRLSAAKGAKLAWLAPGPVPVLDTVAALAAKAPHPHAAMLMIDYILSKEGQAIYRRLGYLSSRKGPSDEGASDIKKLFLANRPDYLQEFEKWAALYNAVFVRDAASAHK
jgi:iron(III) transport system substrate-binding protein